MKNNYGKLSFRAIFWALVLIIGAALLIIDGAGGLNLGYEVSWWRILLGVLFVGWAVFELIRFRIHRIFFPLAFAFLVFEDPIIHAINSEKEHLISPWVVLLAALMLTIGFGLLLSRHTKMAKANFSKSGYYLDAGKDLANAVIHDNLGTAEVYITNRRAYNGSGVITVKDNLGKVRIHLPATWLVAVQSSDNLANIEVPEQNYETSLSITLVVKDNMGSVKVVFD